MPNPEVVCTRGTTYQTWRAWQATIGSGHFADAPPFYGDPPTGYKWTQYKDALFIAAADLGISSFRLETFPYEQNTHDYYQDYLDGIITLAQLGDARGLALEGVGQLWHDLDDRMGTYVVPYRNVLQQRTGISLQLELCLQCFQTNPSGYYIWDTGADWAAFMLSAYQHLQTTHGIVPDWYSLNEPDNMPSMDGTKIANGIYATANALEGAGFTAKCIVPSDSNPTTAASFWDAIRTRLNTLCGSPEAANTWIQAHIISISYHTYTWSDVPAAHLKSEADGLGIGTAMTEYMDADADFLYRDINTIGVSLWQKFVLGSPGNSNTWITISAAGDSLSYSAIQQRLALYARHIKRDMTRFSSTCVDTAIQPVGFENSGAGRLAVVVRVTAAKTFDITGLPAGTYKIQYTLGSGFRTFPSVTISAGQSITVAMSAAGVAAVYIADEAVPGSISGSLSLTHPSVNLTTEGSIDWAKWARAAAADFDHKLTGGTKISDITLIGGSKSRGPGNASIHAKLSWTDGTPTLSATDVIALVYNLQPVGRGFSFTVPADLTTRRVKIYACVYGAVGRLTAYLSDASAPDYTDIEINPGGNLSLAGNYTIDYRAAQAGQTLTITWVIESLYDLSFGNAGLQGVTLQLGSQTYDEALTLSSVAAKTEGGLLTVEQNLSLSNIAAEGATGLLTIEDALNLITSALEVPGANLSVETMLSLGLLAGVLNASFGGVGLGPFEVSLLKSLLPVNVLLSSVAKGTLKPTILVRHLNL